MKLRRAIAGTICVAAVGVLLVFFDRVVNPSQDTVWLELVNLVHIPVFAIVAAGMLGLASSLFEYEVRQSVDGFSAGRRPVRYSSAG